MTQDLHQMTTDTLKRYLSDHRNDEEAFDAAFNVLMGRRDSGKSRHVYPFSLTNQEMEAVLGAKIDEINQAK